MQLYIAIDTTDGEPLEVWYNDENGAYTYWSEKAELYRKANSSYLSAINIWLFDMTFGNKEIIGIVSPNGHDSTWLSP